MKENFAFLINTFVLFLCIRIWMVIARYIGEQLGVSQFINYVLRVIKSKK